MITPTERISLCRILDLMDRHPEFSKQLGLENKSSFQGNPNNSYNAGQNLNVKENTYKK